MSDVEQKRCPGCGQEFPRTDEFFYVSERSSKHGKREFSARCKPCHNKQSIAGAMNRRRKNTKVSLNGHSKVSASINELTIIQPAIIGTWEQCGSCGTMKGNIIGDVDETTHEKYGYLCMKCYKLVHEFGADPNRMRKAIDYVEKTRLVRVAHKKMPTMP